MKKVIIYRYLGTNGIIETPVHLEDVYYTRLIQLTADEGMMLTNGEVEKYTTTIPEEEIDNWTEVPKGQN